MQDQDDLLQVPIFDRALPYAKFLKSFEDEIGPLEDEVCVLQTTFMSGPYRGMLAYELKSGLVVTEERNRYNVWKSRKWLAEREYMRLWNDFIRGAWSSKVPQEEGEYAVRDLEGVRGPNHTFKKINGRLLDISGGFVGYGKVTEYRGQFWYPKFPPLRD